MHYLCGPQLPLSIKRHRRGLVIARVVFEMFVVLIYVLCVYQLVVAELLVSRAQSNGKSSAALSETCRRSAGEEAASKSPADCGDPCGSHSPRRLDAPGVATQIAQR
jgi:hypothetical protein